MAEEEKKKERIKELDDNFHAYARRVELKEDETKKERIESFRMDVRDW